jgi:hypothetical protein
VIYIEWQCVQHLIVPVFVIFLGLVLSDISSLILKYIYFYFFFVILVLNFFILCILFYFHIFFHYFEFQQLFFLVVNICWALKGIINIKPYLCAMIQKLCCKDPCFYCICCAKFISSNLKKEPKEKWQT